MSRLTLAIVVLSCLTVSTVSGASAQSGQGTGATSTATGTGTKPSGVLPAPVGHRQPTRSEVGPNDANPNATDADDKALDRKIKSICRGC
jgi:hypothetical protein